MSLTPLTNHRPQVDRPADQKILCLTSKEFRELATPLLYRSVNLHVGGPQDLRLSAMLGRENPGLEHIRELYLRLEKTFVRDRARYDQSDASSDESEPTDDVKIPARQSHFTVRLLLDFLPRDRLETFRWQSWEPLAVDNFVRLCQRQRRLRVLQVDPTDRALDPVLEKDPSIIENLTELDTLDIYPDCVDRLKAANRLLRAKPNIKQLSVSVWYDLARSMPEELYDSSTRPGVLSRELFSHMMPFERCEPLNLTALELCDVSLRYCADTWVKVVRFPRLERLELQNCEGADVLFAQLSKESQMPQQLHTLRWYDQNKCESHAVSAVSSLLEVLSGVKVIDIYLEGMSGLPRVDGIVKHKDSLYSLSVHSQDRHSNLHYYAEADFGRVCTECTQLTQLSLMFPSTSVEEAYPSQKFRAFLKHAYNLQHLAVLNIRRWPSHSKSFTAPYHQIAQNLSLYEHQLQRLTQRIFVKADERARDNGRRSRARLGVVAWGPNGRSIVTPNDAFQLKQVPFVRGTQLDPLGGREMRAVQTRWNLVQFVERESDILNHSVGNQELAFEPSAM